MGESRCGVGRQDRLNRSKVERVLLLVASLFAVAVTLDPAHAAERAGEIQWCGKVDVATGGGHRGPWRQNESRYDYVDDPTVALDARGAAFVAWVDQRRKDLFFQIYERNGKPRLKQPVNVSRTAQVFSWLPRVVLGRNSSDVYILWQEIVFSGGSHGGDIFFARSRDAGKTFDAPLNISASGGGDGKGRINKDVWHNGSHDLTIAADGTLYAAWTEYDGPLWFSRSTDRGATFSKPVQIGGDSARPARAPTLAAGRGGAVHVAWTVGEDEGADIRIAASADGGRTFGEPRVVAKTPGYSDAPKIAFDSQGTLHIVHAESAAGPFDRLHVRYTRSRDGGRTFEATREISQPAPARSTSATFPALSVDESGNVYVLWELHADPREMPRGLALAVSRDRGNSFSAPELVPDSIDPNGGFNGSQQGLLMRKLAVNGGEIAVVNSSLREDLKSRVWLIRSGCGR
jgi:hypothetical protein